MVSVLTVHTHTHEAETPRNLLEVMDMSTTLIVVMHTYVGAHIYPNLSKCIH